MEWRYEYLGWAIQKLDEGAIFIFSDEDYHNFGGVPHKKQRITQMEEEPRDLHAEYHRNAQFSFMHWGACCVDTEVPMPMHIWEAETPIERKRDEASLVAENKMLREEARRKQDCALQPGTEEYSQLAEINANIQNFNKKRKADGDTGRKGYKRQKKADQVWKFKEVKRDEGKRGIDWFRYRKEGLIPKLYDYYTKIQEKHPDKEVWLVEVNAGRHTKASEIMEEFRKKH